MLLKLGVELARDAMCLQLWLAEPQPGVRRHQPAVSHSQNTEGGTMGGSDADGSERHAQGSNSVHHRERGSQDPLRTAEVERDIDRDYFMTAQEALEYGLIDLVLTPLRGVSAGAESDAPLPLPPCRATPRNGGLLPVAV